MDRSFLSHPDVVVASRKFVCIRLTSYESESETEFCRSMMVGRSGDVENTTFAILNPDGTTKLTRPTRTAKQLFADAADMAQQMNELAQRFTSNGKSPGSLPVALDARIALDVAACDNRPLAVVISNDAEKRASLESRLAKQAWSQEFIGTFIYAVANAPEDLKNVAALPGVSGIALIEPDPFGQAGRVMRFIADDKPTDEIATAMREALTSFHGTSKERQAHRAAGIKLGAFWQTRFAVTDPEEAAARDRTQKQIERQKP